MAGSTLCFVRPFVSLALVVSLVAPAGCARRHWSSVGWFPVGRAKASPEPSMMKMVAPESGVYKVKFATRPDATPDDLHTYGGARRRLSQGDFIGFSTDESGQVYAIARDETFPLPPRVNRKRTPAYLVWTYKTDPRPFEIFGETLGDIGEAILMGALIVGGIALGIWGVWYDLTHPDKACHESY